MKIFAQFCTGDGSGTLIKCPDSAPYCDETTPNVAKCSDKLPVTNPVCPPKPSKYLCMEEGIFPDATNCHKYYQCYKDPSPGKDTLIVAEYECDDLYVFDPSAPNGDYCRFTRNRFCVTVECGSTVKNILMSYPFFPRNKGEIVATCIGTDKTPLMTRCPEGFQANLQAIPAECKLICKKAGKFEFTGDKTKYHECLQTLNGWEAKVKSCMVGQTFDTKTKKCV